LFVQKTVSLNRKVFKEIRRNWDVIIRSITIVSLIVLSLISCSDRLQERPNILHIFSEQQHWQAMGVMDSFFDTPHLDTFAAQSVVF